nr:unnamed protein product [Callosobruchus analis]
MKISSIRFTECTGRIEKLYPDNPHLIKIKEQTFSLHQDGKLIQFLWVPSHTGISENDTADAVAARAVTDEITMTHRSYPDQGLYIKQHLHVLWQHQSHLDNTKLHEIMQNITTHLALP